MTSLLAWLLVLGSATSSPPVFSLEEVECGRAPTGFDLANATLSLEAHGCFGSCPIFVMAVEGTGKVTFVGRDLTTATGRHEATLAPGEVLDLVSTFYERRFFQVPERQKRLIAYVERGEVLMGYRFSGDVETFTLSFGLGDAFQKRVEVGPESPRDLDEIVEAMSKVAKSKGWIP